MDTWPEKLEHPLERADDGAHGQAHALDVPPRQVWEASFHASILYDPGTQDILCGWLRPAALAGLLAWLGAALAAALGLFRRDPVGRGA